MYVHAYSVSVYIQTYAHCIKNQALALAVKIINNLSKFFSPKVYILCHHIIYAWVNVLQCFTHQTFTISHSYTFPHETFKTKIYYTLITDVQKLIIN